MLQSFRTPVIRILLALGFFLSLVPARSANAQFNGAIYTVQEGETLTDIAGYFHTSLNELLALNPIANPDAIAPGKVLLIPGFEDLSGEIVRMEMPAGETAHTLAGAHAMSDALFTRLNFLTSPASLINGSRVFTLTPPGLVQTRLQLVNDLTSLELAACAGVSPWLAAVANNLPAPWQLQQNDTLFLPGDPQDPARAPLASLLPSISELRFSPSPLEQGKTTVIRAQASAQTTLSGELLDYPLHFFPNESGSGFTALQGIPRLADPGVLLFTVTAAAADGRTFTLQQQISLVEKNYGTDTPLQVDESNLDPAITEPEFALLMEIVSPAPPEKLWRTRFSPPSTTPDFITSWYGRLRSYNNSDFTYFHSGIDYGGAASSPILAPAPGIVVYTGLLDVRGNTTIISHGWGVYTGYWHQSQIDVSVGERVETGQTIGMMGETGRVTGPHLHFDVLVGSVEVDPEDWLNGLYASVGE